MIKVRVFYIFLTTALLYACSPSPSNVNIIVSNKLDKARNAETIEIDLKKLPQQLSGFSPEQIVVKDKESDLTLLSQLIDLDGDEKMDLLIFQSDFRAKEQKVFVMEGVEGELGLSKSGITTFARFVPERIDDFAWENDKVAFRTYGPKAQAITDSGKKGGTLSSGIDCWLKRVDYPIIDKWYKQDLEGGKSYHKDHGEGLDNYHVGASRGTGGVGIWNDGTLLTSGNYKSWKIITNGPIRTIFELDYGTWDANGLMVQEIKRISIDLGSNLFKNTLVLGNYNELPNITLGITLHEKAGEVVYDTEKGWARYLEPHDGSELATALVVNPVIIKNMIDHRVEEKDLSNMLVICESAPEVTYYAGFAWKKSKQFESFADFDEYLTDFAGRLASPLAIEVVAK